MAGNGPRRNVTMADVAKRANVSITSVSHVLNRTRPVSASTERSVLAAVADTGYIPDHVVRSLRHTGSRTIGLAMSAISNTYFSEVVRSAEQALSREGYSLLLADTHDEEVQEMRAVNELLSRRVDAILLAPSAHPDRALDHAARQQVPVVLIDRTTEHRLDQVAAENVNATATLVTHLADLGHRHIAMIGGRHGLSTTVERLMGYRRGLRQARLRFNNDLMTTGDSTVDGGRHAALDLLSSQRPPTAVVVGNNAMTIGVMHAARDRGVSIPADLALVGFDDFEWADLFHPRLTVMGQPLQAMGEQAAEMLLSRLRHPSTPARRVIMQPQLIHRESCGCM